MVETQTIIRILAALAGLGIYIHFVCKANFLNHKHTPFGIIVLTCLLICSSVSIIYNAVVGLIDNLLFSFLITVSLWFLLDLLLWYYGYHIGEFFKNKKLK